MPYAACIAADGYCPIRWLGKQKSPLCVVGFLSPGFCCKTNAGLGKFKAYVSVQTASGLWCIQPESNRHDQRSRDFKSLASTNSAMDAAGDDGGSGEIRTHGWVTPSPVFKTGPFNRSGTLPVCWAVLPDKSHAQKSTEARKALKCNV